MLRICSLAVAIVAVCLIIVVSGQPSSGQAQSDKSRQLTAEQTEELKQATEALKRIGDIQKSLAQFNTPEFNRLWARMAYRCGNLDGAVDTWTALAEGGDLMAIDLLTILNGWLTLAHAGDERATYFLQVFGPGDKTAESCQPR